MQYKTFLAENKCSCKEVKISLISIDNASNRCIAQSADGKSFFMTTIPILIADMRNDMCHINNAAKLRSWHGWNDYNDDYPDYPEDYFNNPSKYIIDVTKDISFPKKVSFQYIYVQHK